MLNKLKLLLARLRGWMAENERAHREAKVNSCCSAPDEVYAAVESANPLAADLPNEIAEFE